MELGQSEEWFWKQTPRKFIALLNQKKRIDIEKMKTQAALIWGADIDDPIEKSKGVPGVDRPADPELLKGWC